MQVPLIAVALSIAIGVCHTIFELLVENIEIATLNSVLTMQFI